MALRDYLQKTEDALGSQPQRIADALAYCQTILARFPDALEGQRLLGEVYLAQGHIEEARQSFDWVLTNDPENVIVYCSRALVSERIGDVDTALDCYQQAYELSRGNSQIRQVFNELSKKAGQPGFMLSRAGLARLYMRGSLFSQAQQEWSNVLAQTPDRLDARTGLLELYWLQGRGDLVVQLARQILKTVPDCVKALLLLAYVLAPQDMAQAQDLMRHADTLDPDQLMAHDLFADVLSRQPNHPFFQLLKNDPTLLSDAPTPVAAQKSAPVTEDQPFSARPASSPDIFSQLSAPNSGSDITMVGSPRANRNAQYAPDVPNADANSENNTHGDERLTPTMWDAPVQDTASSAHRSEPVSPAPSQPWDLLQQTLNDMGTQGVEQQPDLAASEPVAWSELPSPATPESAQAGTERSIGDLNSPSLWGTTPEESPPPDWLNMLSQFERNQLDGMQYPDAPAESQTPPPAPMQMPAPPEQAVAQPQETQEQQQEANDSKTYLDDDEDEIGLPTHDTLSPWMKEEEPVVKQEPAALANVSHPETKSEGDERDENDEDESLFGPDWLKSLGATSLNGFSTEMPAVAPSASAQQTALDTQQTAQSPVSRAEQEEPSTQQEDARPVNDVDTTRSMSPEESWAAFIQNDTDTKNTTNITSTPNEQSTESDPSSAEPPSWLTQMAASQPANSTASEEASSQPAIQQKDEQQEQNVAAMLQELEQRYSSGFVPLEPNSLSSIAQAQNNPSGTYEDETQDMTPQSYEDSALSSALAELQSYSPPADETQESGYQQEVEEPAWLAALRSSAAPQTPVFGQGFTPDSSQIAAGEQANDRFEQSGPEQEQGTAPEPFGAPVNESTEDETRTRDATGSSEQAIESTNSFAFNPMQFASAASAADALSSARPNPLLENELETTMRRPAVRLQPVQQKSGFMQEQDRAFTPAVGDDANYREHLLNGYQAQLLGDFDGAMREYRMIIRNAPDLLGEVVSNIRALLKLAPNYSAGYRVLGDAYMRQGEYLQAMESYNRALTMVKKAKN